MKTTRIINDLNKRVIILFKLVIILFIGTDILSAQSVQWAKKGISQGYEYGNAIATDELGDVYVAGQIEYSTVFDGGVTLTTNGGHDIFVGKYGSDGRVKWMHHAGGTSGDVGYGVGVDANHNVYISGEVELTASFGSGISVTSEGSNDIILAKYDDLGNILWVKRFGGSGNDKSRALAVSPTGDCYLTGYYSDDLTFGGTTLTHSGNSDIFIVKINSTGNVQWAKKATGINEDRGYGIAFDNSGNVFVTGKFTGSTTFSGTTISNGGASGAFLAKYDSNGNFQWVKSTSSGSSTTESNCVATDENGFIYMAGFFEGSINFSSIQLNSSGSSDVFIVKYNQAGDVIWAKKAGGPNEDIAYGITVDTVSHLLYLTGQIDDYGYFDSHYAGAAGNRDVFIAAYNLSGNSIWAKCYGGNQRDIGYAITTDNRSNIFSTGIFSDYANFGSYTLNGYPVSDFFITKFSPAPASSPTVQSSGLSITPFHCSDLYLSLTPGNGSRRLIVVREGNAVNSFPVDGNSYNANNVFGLGSNLGNDNYVVYDGTGTDVIVTGLSAGLTYHFAVFEYNGLFSAINYLTSSPATEYLTSGTVNVTVSSSNNSICNGDSATIQAFGASIYSWEPFIGLSSDSGSQVVASPNGTIIYTVTGEDTAGCMAQAQITITVKQNPVVTLLNQDSICLNNAPVILTGGSPAGGTFSGTAVSSGVFDPSISGAGNFIINYVFTDTNNCSGSSQAVIVVNPLPNVSTTTMAAMCENGIPVVLTNGYPTGGQYIGAGVTTGTFDPSIGIGSYPITYSFTDNFGCTDTSLFTLEVEPEPVVNLGSDTLICAGNTILIDAGQGFNSYLWSTGATSSTILIDSNGTGIGTLSLTLEISSSSGCLNSDTINITFDLCAGMEEPGFSENNIKIFPNPFNSYFTIESDRKISISIFDASGKLTEKYENVAGSIITGDNYSPGTYFIVLFSDRYRKTFVVSKSQ